MKSLMRLLSCSSWILMSLNLARLIARALWPDNYLIEFKFGLSPTQVAWEHKCSLCIPTWAWAWAWLSLYVFMNELDKARSCLSQVLPSLNLALLRAWAPWLDNYLIEFEFFQVELSLQAPMLNYKPTYV